MPPLFIEHKLHIPTDQHTKLKRAIAGKTKQVSLKISNGDLQKQGTDTLLLTTSQILKMQQARTNGTAVTITMRRKQIDANTKHEGGFLSLLAALASRVLPVLIGGLASGVISGGIERAITSKKKKGDGFYLNKNNSWYKLSPGAQGRGLYLAPRPPFQGKTYGNGLFAKRDNQITEASGLLLGPNSPFRNVPLLNLLL